MYLFCHNHVMFDFYLNIMIQYLKISTLYITMTQYLTLLTFYLIIIQHYISIYVINVLVMIYSFYIIIMIYQSMVFFSYVVDGVPKQISLVNSHTLLLTYSCCPVYKIFHCLLFCIELSSDTMQLCSLHMYIRTHAQVCWKHLPFPGRQKQIKTVSVPLTLYCTEPQKNH